METQNEKTLIEKSRQGDESAFAILMKTYESKIFSVCFQIIKDEELAKDLTQETFVHAYQHLDTFRMESKFYTWIYRIAHNLSLNLLRKQKRGEQELKEAWIAAPQKKEDFSEEYNRNLKEALGVLSPKQRIVFELFDVQKLPHKEIAAQLHIPAGTVRSRIHYARKKVREHFKKRNQNPR